MKQKRNARKLVTLLKSMDMNVNEIMYEKLLETPIAPFRCSVQFACENPWPKKRPSPKPVMSLYSSMPISLKIKMISQTLNPLYFPDVKNRDALIHATNLSTL